MAVVIIVNPNMISSIPNQKYVIFMYKKIKIINFMYTTELSYCMNGIALRAGTVHTSFHEKLNCFDKFLNTGNAKR